MWEGGPISYETRPSISFQSESLAAGVGGVGGSRCPDKQRDREGEREGEKKTERERTARERARRSFYI